MNCDFTLAVVGSRTFNDYNLLKEKLDDLNKKYNIVKIVSGGARGADQLSEIWARENMKPTKILYPEWKKHGKSAGIIRNKEIVSESDYVVAFWDGTSKGTKSSIEFAQQFNKHVEIIYF